MTFKTSLLAAVDNATYTQLDGNELDDCSQQLDGMIQLNFPGGAHVVPPFANQAIEIDDQGNARAHDTQDAMHTFHFAMLRPMDADDLPAASDD